MGVVFIIVRNYPWWAIPLGLSLILESFRSDQGGKPKTGKKKFFLVFSGLLLVSTSAAFLYYGGHKIAVPIAHELFKEFFR